MQTNLKSFALAIMHQLGEQPHLQVHFHGSFSVLKSWEWAWVQGYSISPNCHSWFLLPTCGIELTELLCHFSSGLLRPTGATEVMFTPPSPLQFMVELLPEYSRRRLFNSFSNITYEWSHNDSILNGRTRGDDASGVRLININGNRLAVPRTKSMNAGSYSSQIDSFGFANYTNRMCARIVLQALRNYAIFQPVEFQAVNGKVTLAGAL